MSLCLGERGYFLYIRKKGWKTSSSFSGVMKGDDDCFVVSLKFFFFSFFLAFFWLGVFFKFVEEL